MEKLTQDERENVLAQAREKLMFNFYACDHRPHDGRMSEGEEYCGYEEAETRAAALGEVWKCECVKMYERGCDEVTCVDANR